MLVGGPFFCHLYTSQGVTAYIVTPTIKYLYAYVLTKEDKLHWQKHMFDGIRCV